MLLSGVRVAFVLLIGSALSLAAAPVGAYEADSDVPAPLANAVREALAVWGHLATTGDTTALPEAFADGGPQSRQLEEEASVWDVGDHPEPLRFTILELRLRSSDPETATVWARVEVTRAGFKPRIVSWDFDLVRRGDRWKVWTVLAAGRPQAVVLPRLDSSTTSTTSSTTTHVEEPSEQKDIVAHAVDSGNPSSGVRLPALSAWIVVITVVGVALAGYLAPRLERGRQQ